MDQLEGYEKLMKQDLGPPTIFEQIRCPTINKEYIMAILKLPDTFLGSCTLKEGTFVTILILQSVAVTFTAYISLYLTLWRSDGDQFWEEKFKFDYDQYMENKNQDIIKTASGMWYEMTLALVITHSVYFITGLGVCYGLCNNHANPLVYIPWLLMTGWLVTTAFITSFLMLIVLFILTSFRNISVTWDVVPMICVFLYAVMWAYGFRIVIAHYKRRRIVEYWRKNKRKDFFDDN